MLITIVELCCETLRLGRQVPPPATAGIFSGLLPVCPGLIHRPKISKRLFFMQTFTIHKGVDMMQNPSSFNTFAVD